MDLTGAFDAINALTISPKYSAGFGSGAPVTLTKNFRQNALMSESNTCWTKIAPDHASAIGQGKGLVSTRPC